MFPDNHKNILIAPLDWGLGHTARCVPLARYIQSLGHIPIIACNEMQRRFIEETFGAIDIIHLDGYNVTYSKWNRWGQMGLLSQLPRIIKTIRKEHQWLRKQAGLIQIDGIISDNRYGLYLPGTPSVIMTHQLQVQTGLGGAADRAAQVMHYKCLDRFDATWVVDTGGVPNLGGKLSHTARLPRVSGYVGLLSRFDKELCRHEDAGPGPLLILLSGPEPQRGQFSALLWRQLRQYPGRVTFVDGSENALAPAEIPPNIMYHKQLTGKDLAPMLCEAAMVICRSGYSTIMDLVATGKRAILVPTPGQTEQKYLGAHLYRQGIFYCAPQNGFDLSLALKEAAQFPFRPLQLQQSYGHYKIVLDEWIGTL